MTAYDLFKRIYYHSMGQFLRHLWTTNKDNTSLKAYIEQSFEEVLDEYTVDYAYSNGFKLSYNGNFTNKKIIDLKQIEIQAGYWLCNYDGHTSDWLAMYYDSKSGAKEAYKQLYNRSFRHQEWFHTMKVK